MPKQTTATTASAGQNRAEHTPGPWEASRDAVPAGYTQSTIYAEASGERVATVFQTPANVSLIAAAPDLLAALIRAQDHLIMSEGAFVCDGKIGYSSDWKEAMQQVREALDKAKGGAK